MEITGKVLREVEFRDRLRGYDTDEVDEFLEQVAVAIDDLHRRLGQPDAQAPAPQPAPERVAEPVAFDDDSIRRTLVLAQRTADLAIKEAREEAAQILDEAHRTAEELVTQATATAQQMRAEADEDFASRISTQLAQREQLERDVRSLNSLVGEERDRIADSLQTVLRYVTENLSISGELNEYAATPPPVPTAVAPSVATPTVPSAPIPPTERLFDDDDDDDLALNELDQLDNDPPSSFTAPMPAIPTPATGAPVSDPDEELWQRWAQSDEFDDENKDDPSADPFGFDRRP